MGYDVRTSRSPTLFPRISRSQLVSVLSDASRRLDETIAQGEWQSPRESGPALVLARGCERERLARGPETRAQPAATAAISAKLSHSRSSRIANGKTSAPNFVPDSADLTAGQPV